MIDINSIQELLISAAWLLPLTIGIVHVIKLAANPGARWLPAISLVVGAILGAVFIGVSLLGFAAGLIFGLSASGLWDFGKRTVAGQTGQTE